MATIKPPQSHEDLTHEMGDTASLKGALKLRHTVCDLVDRGIFIMSFIYRRSQKFRAGNGVTRKLLALLAYTKQHMDR